MESVLNKDKVLFETLLFRLIFLVNLRIRNGEYTERGLARILGVSQPHIHNVLKEKRLLSIETSDRILRRLRMDLLDLVRPEDLAEWQRRR